MHVVDTTESKMNEWFMQAMHAWIFLYMYLCKNVASVNSIDDRSITPLIIYMCSIRIYSNQATKLTIHSCMNFL